MNYTSAFFSVKTRGFTLIELLVSMAIFSIMAGGMYLVFNNFSKVKEITDRDSKRLAELQRAFSFMHKDLSFIIPRPVTDEFDSENPLDALTSSGDAIEFTRSGWNSPPFLARKRSELQRVSYALEEGVLKRNYWYVLDRAQDSLSRGLVLLTNVEELSFIFYFEDSGSLKDAAQWPPLNPVGWSAIMDCGFHEENDIRLPDVVEMKIKTSDYGEISRKYSVLSGYGFALNEVGCL
ncbi:type II secretion system protein GspJ [Gammaproteobacteria bacterium 42_54_T18]|nr:type II secretion system protein GspJ [Gammaproteobacteria bacterium 42_54_T18]